MKKVVFICHGNTFRSPVAKAFYNQLKKDDSFAVSYGTHVLEQGYQNSKPYLCVGMEPEIFELKKYSLNLSNETCNQLKEEYLADADKIIFMAEKEYIPEWLGKYKYEYWDIPNPDVFTAEGAEALTKLIRQKVVNLIG